MSHHVEYLLSNVVVSLNVNFDCWCPSSDGKPIWAHYVEGFVGETCWSKYLLNIVPDLWTWRRIHSYDGKPMMSKGLSERIVDQIFPQKFCSTYEHYVGFAIAWWCLWWNNDDDDDYATVFCYYWTSSLLIKSSLLLMVFIMASFLLTILLLLTLLSLMCVCVCACAPAIFEVVVLLWMWIWLPSSSSRVGESRRCWGCCCHHCCASKEEILWRCQCGSRRCCQWSGWGCKGSVQSAWMKLKWRRLMR